MIGNVGSSLMPFGKLNKVLPQDYRLQKILKSGIIRIGYANDQPFSYKDHGAKRITGESWEIAKEILGRMGVRMIDGIETDFWSLIPKLRSGQFDMIASGVFMTPQRCKEIIFSYPTYKNREGLLVRAGNPLALKTFYDVMRHPVARVGVVYGSVAGTYIRSMMPTSRIVPFSDIEKSIKALSAGDVDAFISSRITLQWFLREGIPSVMWVPAFEGLLINNRPVEDYGAFGFRLEDRGLRDAFDSHLRPFIGSEAHLDSVRNFGFGTEELPSDPLPFDVQKMWRT
jgi:polar amino acid transport system substrate-binding protein